MNKRWSGLALVGLVIASLACGIAEAPSVTPTSPPQPTPMVEGTTEPTPLEPSPTPPPTRTQEASPTPEPTGEGLFRLVYTGRGGLWITGEGEEPRQLTSGADSDPVFSPDGRRILFRRQLPPGPSDLPRLELRVIEVDGSGERGLVGPEDLPGEMGTPAGSDEEVLLDRLPLQAAWFSDSQTVAFNTHMMVGYGQVHNDDLWLVDVETGALTRLLDDGEGGDVAISPTGDHLLVSDSTTVRMMDADGRNRRTLVSFQFVNTASEYAYRPRPVWAPDGTYGLVAIASPEPFEPGATGTLWRLPLTGDGVPMATLEGDFLSASMGTHLWSPDRAWIAYTAPVEGNQYDLIIAEGDGSQPTVYATGRLGFLRWAPDSQRFAFWQNQPGEVYYGEMGEPPARLASPEEAYEVRSLRWLDRETFVYVSGGGGTSAIRLGRIDGPHRTIDSTEVGFAQLDVYP